MKKIGQKGFTLVEVLLIIIALSLIVGVGAYVVNANKKNDSSDNKAKNSEASKLNTTIPQKESEKKIVINELGVEIPKDGLDDVVFEIDSSPTDLNGNKYIAASFSSMKLTEAFKACGGDLAGQPSLVFGGVDKFDGQFNTNEPPIPFSGELLKQFAGFALVESTPDGGYTCKTNQAAFTKQLNDTKTKLNEAFKKAELSNQPNAKN